MRSEAVLPSRAVTLNSPSHIDTFSQGLGALNTGRFARTFLADPSAAFKNSLLGSLFSSAPASLGAQGVSVGAGSLPAATLGLDSASLAGAQGAAGAGGVSLAPLAGIGAFTAAAQLFQGLNRAKRARTLAEMATKIAQDFNAGVAPATTMETFGQLFPALPAGASGQDIERQAGQLRAGATDPQIKLAASLVNAPEAHVGALLDAPNAFMVNPVTGGLTPVDRAEEEERRNVAIWGKERWEMMKAERRRRAQHLGGDTLGELFGAQP